MLPRLFSRKPAPADPFAIVQGVLDTLEQRAGDRNDMAALGKLRDARKVITTEALRAAR